MENTPIEKINRKGINNPNVFKAGNQLYKMRTKDGRDKLFNKDNQEEFFQLLTNYFKHCNNKKLYTTDFIKAGGQAGQIVDIPHNRPTSIKGFCAYIGIAHETYLCYEKDEKYSEYSEWFKYARTLLESELQDQALIGNVNPMVAVRVLQLSDKSDITAKVDQTYTSIVFSTRNIEDIQAEIVPSNQPELP